MNRIVMQHLFSGDFCSINQKIKNRQITEASPAYLTLEGEGDAFQFYQT
jgi:hypothetical protein